MRLTPEILLLIVLSGCPKAVPESLPAPAPVATQEQLLAKEVAALEAEALALVKEQDELLWEHWTQGTPLDLEKPALSHAVLFEDATLLKVRRARNTRLEAWLVGERLARATAEANATLTGIEAIATFTLDEKATPLSWRDLNRLLAHEKSAVKRKALWAASREAIPKIAEGYQKRDEAVESALRKMGTTGAGYAGVTSEESAVLAQRFLDDTQGEWKALLEQLAKSELGLPVDKLTRADLPRLLRPTSPADGNFLKAEQAAKATAVLAALGFYGLPGLTLDLAESATKNPLPLTLAPGGAADVRVSFRPAGGARDLSVLLGELGRALALHKTDEPRLAPPLLSDASYRLFAELGSTAGWLKAQGVSDAAAASTIASARALRLYACRRAAGNLIAQHNAQGATDAFSAEAWKDSSTHALAIPAAAEDAARWRLERDPLYKGVDLLRALQLAEQLRKKLGAEWWSAPGSGAILRAAWSGSDAGANAVGIDGGRVAGAVASVVKEASRDAGLTPVIDPTDSGFVGAVKAASSQAPGDGGAAANVQ